VTVAVFSKEELEHIENLSRRLTMLYLEVKVYILTSEKAAAHLRRCEDAPPREKISALAINELRNAFDHEMRARNVLSNPAEVPEESKLSPFKYCEKNFDKAIGHVYRAGYDALDILSASKLEEIRFVLTAYTMRTRIAVFDSFSRDIRIPIEEAEKLCNEAKKSKDVESSEAERKAYKAYLEATDKLQDVLDKLYEKLPELTEVQEEGDAENKNRNMLAYVLCGAGILAGAIIAVLF
jgi:hypothetical protein